MLAEQIELPWRAKDGTRRSGKVGNKGGRKAKHGEAGVPHRKRVAITRHLPMHVTLRLAADVGQLRSRRGYAAIQRATFVTAARHDARIIHVSIQRTHVHLIVEADDARQLGEGMRRFAISAARQINAMNFDAGGSRRRGKVFPDRYHARVITVPKQARHALAYVLNNWRHHRDARSAARLDPYSSAAQFDGWRDVAPEPAPEGLVVREPKSWLLRVGWRRHGLLAVTEVPG
jgi:REP element-mobilizing transposase RayT